MYFFHGSPRLGYLFCWRFVHNRCALTQRPACADRTAAALFSRAAVDDRPPRMTLIAEPPDLAAAAYGQVGKFQRGVFLRVPLGFKRGDLHRHASFQALLCVRCSTGSRCPPSGSIPWPANCDPWSTATIPFDDFRRKRRTGSDRRSSRHPTHAAACRGHALCNTGAKTFSYMPPLHSVYVEFVELRCPTILHIFCKLIIYCYLTNINR